MVVRWLDRRRRYPVRGRVVIAGMFSAATTDELTRRRDFPRRTAWIGCGIPDLGLSQQHLDVRRRGLGRHLDGLVI